ncbi:DNA-binding protein, partial [Mycobacterium sp. ITM-2017-0098]
MSSIPSADDVLDPDEAVYDLPAVAQLMGLPVTRVHQQLRERHLVAVRRADRMVVPQV